MPGEGTTRGVSSGLRGVAERTLARKRRSVLRHTTRFNIPAAMQSFRMMVRRWKRGRGACVAR